jgi:ATP-dependent DNA ligase
VGSSVAGEGEAHWRRSECNADTQVISEALSVQGRGRELFELMRAHDLEGIVAKRLADPYDSRVRWFKIKNANYTQKEGRGKLFNKH